MSPPKIRTLCFGVQRIRDNSSLYMVLRSVSLLTMIGLSQEMIVVLGLPLNGETDILGCIFSKLLSDVRGSGAISIPTPSIEMLTEFFHADPDRCPSIAGIMVFCTFALKVAVFLYAYCLRDDLSQTLSALEVGLFYLRF